jgi:N-acetylmuramoyl-L-alanine amidase
LRGFAFGHGFTCGRSSASDRWCVVTLLFLLAAAPAWANRAQSLNLGTTDAGTWISVGLESEAEFSLTADGNTLKVRITGAAPSATLTRPGKGAVAEAKVVADGRDALLVIQLVSGSYTYRAYAKRNPFQVCVDVIPKAGTSTTTDFTRPSGGIKLIVLDPGHGGSRYTGTATYDERIPEKEAVFEQAKILKKLLEDNLGVEVVLTRTGDYEVGLKGRCLMANEIGADLFVSLHLNGSSSSSAKGTETFYLISGQTTTSRAAAMLENADFQSDPDLDRVTKSALEFILSDAYQTLILDESARLANYVHGELLDELGLKDRGVKQDNFAVLRGTHMPAILVESYFMTAKREADLYTNPDGYRRVAEAIYRGISAYIKDYDKRME